jgi:GNAT superfamily N-acetyltransferase
MFSVRQVDGSLENQAALLHWLQLETLSGDTPLTTIVGWWWILYQDDRPIGFCSLRRSAQWGDTGYLCRAGILPKYRGKGLQKRLIRVRERQAKRLKMNWLITDTYNNPASANSIIACGFRMFTPSKPWGADETCYWRKKL